MPTKKEQAESVSEILARARANRASLGDLGTAHDLAVAAGLPACASELLGHLRTRVSADRPSGLGRDVLVGLATGLLTHQVLKGT